MTQSVAVLGRQPALGLAELESLYGADKVRPLGEHAAIVDVDPCLFAFDRLGGTVRFCKLLTVLDTIEWKEIERFLVQVSPGHSQRMPEGKMQLGLSVIGLRVGLKQLEATGLTLKKAIRGTGRSVRLVPNKELELNSAQILYNKLTGPTGWELVFIRDGAKTYIAQTVKVQDIEAYAARDQARPKRDARVGMLPPKLAQIIVNLAVGALPDEARQSVCDIPPDQPIPAAHFAGVSVLDPFCGTGVLLQEALLMGYEAYGSDLEPRMIEYSQTNLEWLTNRFKLSPDSHFKLEVADATSHTWDSFSMIACETYLGRPFSALPSPKVLEEVMQDVDTIHRKFLKNLARQTKAGFRLCIAAPAWKTKNGFMHLPMLDHLTDMGYTRLVFAHVDDRDLVYHRPEQIVARELVVLIRK